MPTCQGLSAASMDPANKSLARDVGYNLNRQQTLMKKKIAMAKFQTYEAFLLYIQNEVRANLAVAVAELRGIDGIEEVYGLNSVNTIKEEAVQRLTTGLRSIDVVSSLDSHRLIVLLPGVSDAAFAHLAAHKIQRLLSAPYKDFRSLHFSSCVGISLNQNHEETIEAVLCRALTALRQSFQSADTIKLYDIEKEKPYSVEYHALVDLEAAIKQNQLQLLLQPQYSLHTNKIVSAEALLRWKHPQYGMINIERLIRLVERTNLIMNLTSWVITSSLRYCAEFRKFGLDVGVHINLSVANLREKDLLELIECQLEIWGVPAHKLVIELTETFEIEANPFAYKQLMSLKNIGVQISMDDFGTGYANLDRLFQLPLDELKIDKHFTQMLATHSEIESMIKGIMNIAHLMGISVVVEGIEDKETFGRLAHLGCDVAQGYYISRPISQEDFIKDFIHSDKGIRRLSAS